MITKQDMCAEHYAYGAIWASDSFVTTQSF